MASSSSLANPTMFDKHIFRGLARDLPGKHPDFFFDSQGITSAANIWQHDLPEIPELDNLFAPEVLSHETEDATKPSQLQSFVLISDNANQGPIKEAHTLASQAFGSRKTWFLVNGR